MWPGPDVGPNGNASPVPPGGFVVLIGPSFDTTTSHLPSGLTPIWPGSCVSTACWLDRSVAEYWSRGFPVGSRGRPRVREDGRWPLGPTTTSVTELPIALSTYRRLDASGGLPGNAFA